MKKIKKLFIVILPIVFLIVFSIFFLLNNFRKKNINSKNLATSAEQKKIYTIKEFIENENYAVSLLSVEKINKLDANQFETVGDRVYRKEANVNLKGNYLVLTLKIHNRTNDSIKFDKADIKLQDDNKKEYFPLNEQRKGINFVQLMGKENMLTYVWKPTFQHDAYVIFNIPENAKFTRGLFTIKGAIFGEHGVNINVE